MHGQLEIAWQIGNRMAQCISDFKECCGLPGVVGAIDGTHFAIRKPYHALEDYYYFKIMRVFYTGTGSCESSSTLHRRLCWNVGEHQRRLCAAKVWTIQSRNDIRPLQSRILTLTRGLHHILSVINVTLSTPGYSHCIEIFRLKVLRPWNRDSLTENYELGDV